MRVLVPITFDITTMLTSSSATNAYADYSSTSTYAIGDKVTHLGRYFEAMDPVGTGTEWAPSLDESFPWLNIGAANYNAMWDDSPTSISTATGTLTVVVTPGDVDSAAFFNVSGDTLTLIGAVGTSTTYTGTASVAGVSETVFSDLPGGTGLSLTAQLTASSGVVSVGAVVFGNAVSLGTAQSGAEASIIDYSTKQTDAYGDTVLVQRAFAKTLTVETLIPNSQMNTVIRTLQSLRATPTTWIASTNDDFSAAGVVYGYYRDFSIDIRYPTYSICNLEIEGLV